MPAISLIEDIRVSLRQRVYPNGLSMKNAILIISLLIVRMPAWAHISESSTYDECITESMQGVTSDVAATAIISSCREQYPVENTGPAAKPRSLSAAELRKISAKAKRQADLFTVSFHNGNAKLTISEVTISIASRSNSDKTRKYRAELSMPPLGSASATYTILFSGDNADINWSVASALGHE